MLPKSVLCLAEFVKWKVRCWVADTHTDTQTKYCNPRCTCAPRVSRHFFPGHPYGLCLVCLLLFCLLPFRLLKNFLLLFSVVSHIQLKFNVDVLWNKLLVTYIHTYIQVYNFLNLTQLLSALIYSSKKYSFENFSWTVFSLFSFCLNTHLVGSTTPPASSCSKDTSVAACSVLNSSYMFESIWCQWMCNTPKNFNKGR